MTTTVQPRAALYVRLSDDKNATGDNVADQEAGGLKVAERLGATVVQVYSDNDRPASDPKRKPRPAFEEMLADAEAGTFDLLVIRHADRLYRTAYDQGRIAEVFGPRKIVIHQEWAGYPLDLSTPTGVLTAGIMAQVAQYETDHKRERQRSHNRSRIHAGKPPEGGPVPFGYAEDRLTPHEPEATMVRKAHRALLRGASLGSIIRQWNASGVTAPRGGRWSYSTIRGVLTRPLNAGLVYYAGRVQPGVTGLWKPLVTEEEHRAVVALLSDPTRRTTDGNNRKHLLSGVACCGSCGRPMKSGHTSSRGVKSYLYRCVNSECSAKVYTAREALNAEVETRFLAERGHLKVYRLLAIDGRAEALADIEARITSTSARLGDDDADMAALVERLAELKAERARLKVGPPVPQVEVGTVAEEWAGGDLDRKRELLLEHLETGGLRVSRRGSVSHRFHAERVTFGWKPILLTEGPVTLGPDTDDNLGVAPLTETGDATA